MKKQLFILLTLTLFIAGSAFAGHHERKEVTKTGILLVAFGSSEASAQISFETLEKKTRAAYPEIPVFWAYTSHIIREKLAGQGKVLNSPEAALARMADEKFTHVAVQSLHTIAGAEYHDLRRVVGAYQTMGCFEKILLGYPLLSSQEDMARAVDAILENIPEQRSKDEAVVLMGHGTHHPSNAFYAALMFQVQLRDPNVFIGTVEGYPGIKEIQGLLAGKNISTAWLMPLMSVAGDHAKNDMAGNEADSWKSVLTAAGITCRPVLKGTAEYDNFVEIWVDHIQAPLSHF